MIYKVKLENYEGPLDLLLTLISKKELDIYDISLTDITDEYLAYIDKLKELNLEIASEFLLIAATLLEIKSRGLLPDETEEIELFSADAVRRELIKRLLHYRKFKNCAQFLKQSLEVGSRYHRRDAELEEAFVGLMPDFDEEITTSELAKHLLHLVRVRHFAFVSTNHITTALIKVEDQIEYLAAKLRTGPQNFKELTRGFGRQEVIVTFLAILELYKRLMIEVKQASNFGQIEIELLEETTSA